MSRFGGGEKCPVCSKTVYFNEEVLAEGHKFHKKCFKCSECKKMLDSTSMAYHEDHLYCDACHRRGFGTKGYGYGIGAGVLASETSETDGPSGMASGSTGYSSYGVGKTSSGGGGGGGGSKFGSSERCPRCGKAVYMAEKIIGAGQSWHKSCFSCISCKKKLDSTTVCDKDGQIYCKSCYGKEFGPKGVGFGQGAGTLTTA